MSESLKPLDAWTAFFIGRFEAQHDGHAWVVDVDFLDFGQRLRLYRDGIQAEVRKSPATFELGEGARIEAVMGLFGMRRIDLVAGGQARLMTPAEGTLEARRLNLARDRPGLSEAIGAISWIVLVIALVAGIGELLSLAGIDTALSLGQPFATILGVAALLAAFERALRFKSNRWLD